MASNITSLGVGGADASASLRTSAGFSTCIGTSELPTAALIRHLLFPVSAVATLLLSTLIYAQPITQPYLILGALTFALTWRVLGTAEMNELRPISHVESFLPRVLYGWFKVLGILLFFGFAAKISASYSRAVIVTWAAITPALYTLAHVLAYRFLCQWNKRGRIARTHVIVGNNARAHELASRLEQDPTLGTLIGFFDNDEVASNRSDTLRRASILGTLEELPEYVRRNGIDVIHIADRCETDPAMSRVLDDLRDTTASIYFMLDLPGRDCSHPRVVEMAGLPLLAYFETPHYGLQGVVKRFADLTITMLLLALLWPLFLLIALAVRIDSRGPIIFKQRRYGLNGEEIAVYKFRTMTVCDDGELIVQATRNDPRITRVGRFLRCSSLDELPQLFCVLVGSMSLVGPRPHAVAQNEQYRRQIAGYMMRHKVRPGITGWAQVNGLRGETRTLEQMRQRVRYDLEYLRNWSPWADIRILFRTVLLVIRDRAAY